MAAGPTVRLFESFIVFAVGPLVVGWLFDKFVVVTNRLNMPQDALNTMTWFSYILMAMPFLWLLAIGLNHLVQSSSESGGGV
jgi:hypothetical protein